MSACNRLLCVCVCLWMSFCCADDDGNDSEYLESSRLPYYDEVWWCRGEWWGRGGCLFGVVVSRNQKWKAKLCRINYVARRPIINNLDEHRRWIPFRELKSTNLNGIWVTYIMQIISKNSWFLCAVNSEPIYESLGGRASVSLERSDFISLFLSSLF